MEKLNSDLAGTFSTHKVPLGVALVMDGEDLMVWGYSDDACYPGVKALTEWLLENLPAIKGKVNAALSHTANPPADTPG